MWSHMAWLERALGTVRPEPDADSRPAAGSEALRRHPRVLVVDDNPSNLGQACELLERWGITPALAADGAEAVALAVVLEFDLILMDLQMPVLDGLAATKQIRAHELARSLARASVVAYTSHPLDDDVLRACGVDGVLEKPCSAQTIQECLLRWCAPADSLDREALATAHAWSAP
jgi:CheY-like chemotaxis protein